MHTVVDGILTHYQIVGNKPKTLLILPGWMHTSDSWLPIAKELSKEYSVIILDFPGFGKTPKPEKIFSIFDYAAFVEHFLDKLEVKKITLVAHSFGGRIGIILATQTNRVNELILVDTAGIEKRSALTKMKINFLKQSKIFLPKQTVNSLRNKFGSTDYRLAGHMREIFIKVINEDLTYLLPKISIPTVIIWGNNDTEIPEWKTKLMKKLIKNSRLKVVWGAGHNPYLEKQNEFMEILNDYLTIR